MKWLLLLAFCVTTVVACTNCGEKDIWKGAEVKQDLTQQVANTFKNTIDNVINNDINVENSAAISTSQATALGTNTITVTQNNAVTVQDYLSQSNALSTSATVETPPAPPLSLCQSQC
eukprot:TRINITY_DN8170_c0_g1_i3.p3 TRINITY_DN8170_c0_g1~~TRINITY_DN8170_c0_g1_i3.p3  ORF type:complete len:118 (-),score=7.47 TRINITY_DN8170_c0_g1_i3:317-670(-)